MHLAIMLNTLHWQVENPLVQERSASLAELWARWIVESKMVVFILS